MQQIWFETARGPVSGLLYRVVENLPEVRAPRWAGARSTGQSPDVHRSFYMLVDSKDKLAKTLWRQCTHYCQQFGEERQTWLKKILTHFQRIM